jgi:2-methylisocitrate lyase-like PEP mutase family enzyme
MNDIGTARSQVPVGLRLRPQPERVRAFRDAMSAPEPLLIPGVTSAALARLVERQGFKACYATGAGISNFSFGIPDIGLLGRQEMAHEVTRIADTTTLPVFADMDNGYGGPISVMRAMHDYERAGIAAVQLEDQTLPKRCGHFAGKSIVPVDEMVAKVRAAVAARTGDTVVVARTDAIAIEGIDHALDRARAYLRAGADVLFVEAPRSREEIELIGRTFRGVPLLANVVEGGQTPALALDEFAELGFNIVLYANTVMRVVLRAAEEALKALQRDGGSAALTDRMFDWERRQELVGLDLFDSLEDRLRTSVTGS